MATKMVPKLTPEQECTLVPKEVCNLTYGPPKVVQKPYMSEWCLDESEDNEITTEKITQPQTSSSQEESRYGFK